MRYKIEAWNQPEGPGYGWAPCSARKAERFFVFDKDGVRVREFKTRAEAQAFVETQKGKVT